LAYRCLPDFIPPLFAADLAARQMENARREIADLINLPICQDEKLRTAMR